VPDKLPAQFAWALKPSDLEGAFDGVDRRSVFSISFIGNQALDRRMIDADWSPGRHNEFGGNLHLWVRPVRAYERHSIRTVLVKDGLPEVVRWVEKTFNAPPTWRDLHHRRVWWVEHGDLLHRDDAP